MLYLLASKVLTLYAEPGVLCCWLEIRPYRRAVPCVRPGKAVGAGEHDVPSGNHQDRQRDDDE